MPIYGSKPMLVFHDILYQFQRPSNSKDLAGSTVSKYFAVSLDFTSLTKIHCARQEQMGNVLAAGWFRREGKLAAVQLVHTSDGSPGWRHINDSTSTPSASQHHTNNFSVNDEHKLSVSIILWRISIPSPAARSLS